MAEPVDGLVHRHRAVGPQADRPPPERAHLENLAVDRGPLALAYEPPSRLEFLARVNEGVPEGPRSRIPVLRAPQQQALHRATGRIAPAEQARRENARVVHDQQVAGVEQPRQVRHDRALGGACRAVERQQARGAPPFGRRLRDEVLREVEVEVGDVHGR
jgi:hypothetical protein